MSISSIKQMERGSHVLCYLCSSKFTVNSQTPTELSYTDDKFPFKYRGTSETRGRVPLFHIPLFLKLRDNIS
jgi:hypothetical protein